MSSERRSAEPLVIALRTIRRSRGLSTARVAELMGMDRRSYANFEAGKGRPNVTRLLAFAQITDSDPWAILAAVLTGSPRVALAAADNKMVMAFFILFGEFERELGEAVRLLDTADVVSVFGEAFKSLESLVAEKRARLPADWLQEGAARIGLGSGPPDEEDDD